MNRLLWLAAVVLSSALLSSGGGMQSPFSRLRGPYLGQEPPGDAATLFAPEILDCSEGYHSSIVFSPDLREAVWCPMSRESGRLLMAQSAQGRWLPPQETDLGMEAGVSDPIFSTDGSRLYFLSFQPDKPGGEARERIWFAERVKGEWSQPKPIDKAVCRHPTHWTFSLARNGNLYFTSEIAGARGGQDIYVARFASGKYLAPEELGPGVNGEGKDFCPFIAPDESYLIFARLGPETRQADLYVSFKNPDGSWTKARDMGPAVNSAGNDLAPYVSPDGCFLFFISQRERRNGIHWMRAGVISRLRPGKFNAARVPSPSQPGNAAPTGKETRTRSRGHRIF